MEFALSNNHDQSLNILLIVIDQLRADCLDLTIGGHSVLPNLSEFSTDAVRFNRHFSVVNPCGPSRASLLTGMYSMNHRSVRNGTPLRNGITNLALEVRKSGYEPLLFGYTDTSGDPRYLHPNDPDIRGYEKVLPGFNEIVEMRQTHDSIPWRSHLHAAGYDLPPYSRFYSPIDYNAAIGPRPDDPAFYKASDSDTAFLTDACLSELAMRKDRKWLTLLTYIRPHPPLIAPEPYNRLYKGKRLPPLARADSLEAEASIHPFLAADLKYNSINSFVSGYNCGLNNESAQDVDALRSVYFGLATEVDHHIGRIINFLKQTQQLDQTLIIITADHGEMLGDRRQWGKMSVFDTAYHIPLLIRDPSGVRGIEISAMTESVDIAATILDRISTGPAVGMNGKSLVKHIQGDTPTKWRDYSYSELDFGEPDRPTRWQFELDLPLRESNLAILREADRTLVHFNGGLPPLLFDTSTANGETVNLAEDPRWSAELLRLTRKLLNHRMRCSDHTLSDMKVTSMGTVNYAG